MMVVILMVAVHGGAGRLGVTIGVARRRQLLAPCLERTQLTSPRQVPLTLQGRRPAGRHTVVGESVPTRCSYPGAT